MCTGILSPQEALAGFANEGMITVGLLFLISEGVRRSDALGHLVKWLLPAQRGMSVRKGYLRILPSIVSVSAFLNNTPVVVVFIPIIKQWARKSGTRRTKIPHTALLRSHFGRHVHADRYVDQSGRARHDAGRRIRGIHDVRIGKVGGCIALVGGLYLISSATSACPGIHPMKRRPVTRSRLTWSKPFWAPASRVSTTRSANSTSRAITEPKSGP